MINKIENDNSNDIYIHNNIKNDDDDDNDNINNDFVKNNYNNYNNNYSNDNSKSNINILKNDSYHQYHYSSSAENIDVQVEYSMIHHLLNAAVIPISTSTEFISPLNEGELLRPPPVKRGELIRITQNSLDRLFDRGMVSNH